MTQIKQLQPRPGITLLAVKVPEGAYDFTLNYLNTGLLYGDDESEAPFPPLIRLPFECKLLGTLDQITEEVWQGIMSHELIGGIGGVGGRWLYPDYQRSNCDGFETATESAMSFLEKHEVYSVNPLGERPSIINHDVWYSEEDWHKAESNTGTWVILQRV